MRIGALDSLLDAFGAPRASAPSAKRRSVSLAAIKHLHDFEGFHRVRPDGRVEAYPDPGTGGEPWTIGYGSTGPDPFNGGRIRKGTIWTREQAEQRFRDHLREFEDGVAKALTNVASQAQFDAMVCLAYNIGLANFGGSTLLRMHNAGDFDGAAKQFLRWNRAGGRVMKGLTRRREAEAAMYRGTT
jgi:GH24 family phage-related lysozyme (muramidase)